ncbi:undecaprenyl-phosphate glucose phosphotransferase [Hufsiella ginkgonis]|uniref:Undecaprenyl-phosphate glucose phosphotransferase n=1 Tax=Hufsiella ginkgonis TaxID=2695274 RepID=A0A7K1Y2A5_9SPHI|nr:undecaprenyl-phosphate glucose phosphotransferase [Hufsiella ginkgonis]MXV17400.1 undecaprenyl-phosphate glucose phosphotransferase [Hufsiella ginkgonis]
MQTRYQYLLRIVLAVSDIFLLNLAFITARFLIDQPVEGVRYMQYIVACNLLWIFCANLFGMYRSDTIERVERIYKSTWRSLFLHVILFIFYLIFFKDSIYSKHFLMYFYTGLFTLFLFSRFAGTVLETVLIRHFKIRKSVAILGHNNTSQRLAAYFKNNKNNFLFEGFLNDKESLHIDENGDIRPAACEQIRIAATNGVKEVYVSLTPQRIAEAEHLIMEAEKQCVRLKFVPDLTGTLPTPFTVNYMGEFPVLNMRHEPLNDMENRFKKRFADIVISLGVIIFVFSWLFPILAILIKCESRGPVFFKQLRSGRDNEPFWCLKFRSMRVNKDSDHKQAVKNDKRITTIGRFIRKTSIDELPQFLNVLAGHMSVVGPRPHMLSHTKEYSGMINQFMVRHFLKPGITGWAQVNGLRGETKEASMMESRVEHDIWYLENWSSMLDVKIIFLTIINVVKGEDNAY